MKKPLLVGAEPRHKIEERQPDYEAHENHEVQGTANQFAIKPPVAVWIWPVIVPA